MALHVLICKGGCKQVLSIPLRHGWQPKFVGVLCTLMGRA